MGESYKQLESKKCCYTCEHNRNNLAKEYSCNCEFENRGNMVYQGEEACEDYKYCGV